MCHLIQRNLHNMWDEVVLWDMSKSPAIFKLRLVHADSASLDGERAWQEQWDKNETSSMNLGEKVNFTLQNSFAYNFAILVTLYISMKPTHDSQFCSMIKCSVIKKKKRNRLKINFQFLLKTKKKKNTSIFVPWKRLRKPQMCLTGMATFCHSC